jgi:hypothetical protein
MIVSNLFLYLQSSIFEGMCEVALGSDSLGITLALNMDSRHPSITAQPLAALPGHPITILDHLEILP